MTERQKHLMFVLQDKHFAEWARTKRHVWDECSSKQELFCVCGRLASTLHESHCGKFIDLVNRETVKKLEHLVKEA
jgi:hypothetical protein